MKIYSSSPYHDDFSESKGFHRILFKPGVAVQARELTQLQTILQNQISRFGQNIFKEGAIVIPGQQSLDIGYKYVKLTTSYNSVDSDTVIEDLVGDIVTGQTTGVRAEVVNFSVATDTDPPTIFVKYLDSGTNFNTNAFSNGEILVNSDESVSLQAAASSATGTGVAYSVTAGVMFLKGNFVYFGADTTIVSKYTTTPSKSIGFVATESTITSDDDASLLDPAVGSYNYFAPGADRYKVALTLTSRSLTPAETDDDNYVELARIEDGILISQKKSTEYNILNDTLARRTYDESGNYIVKPYGLEVIEHLRTGNTNIRDGLLPAGLGGNSALFVNVISPGKSYVLGYELENLKSQYVVAEKARDYKTVNNSTVSTETGNYILISGLYSIPDIATLPAISLYSKYTKTSGSSFGTLVGTARIRSLEYYSGSGVTAIYKAYLFDIRMTEGYSFERDVKQFFYDNSGFADFTANVNPNLVTITGSVSTTNGSNNISGAGTRFISELKTGDYVSVNGNTILIDTVVSDVSAYANVNLVGNVSGVSISRQQANILLPTKATYIYEFPYSTIKEVDPTDIETSYSTRRVYDRTLSGGNVSITAGTDEVFSAYSTDNYLLVDKSDGSYVDLTSKVTRSGSPTGKTVTFTLGAGYGTHDVRIVTTVQKTNSAAAKKTKTLVNTSLDFTSNVGATATVLSLGQADIYSLANVRMSATAFGTSYSATNSIDITDRYVLDNGQKKTHYDIGTLKLKASSPTPTGPIRIYYSYFTHSSGDYFSVDSYTDIDYEDIPTFVDGAKTYQLRDCLDFRPRIDTNGSTFTSPSEFLDPETDLLTDYSYYIGRTDKIVIDSTGKVKVVEGISSESPVEPATPSNAMALYVLRQKPYVFNVKNDIDVSVIDNKRFTMRDIGRIENRVKNLEYYTTLSLLEKDTSLYQIKDSLGFDRFKNGFVVDNFTGHKIGDYTNPDYKNSMDFDKGVLRPSFTQKNLLLSEVSTTTGQRTANNYILTGNLASLSYTSNLFVESNSTSRTENINPFSVINYTGVVTLDPPDDVWFDTSRAPDIHIDAEGNYNTLSQSKYGSIWNAWQTVWYGTERVEDRSGTAYSVGESADTTVNNDIVINKNVLPKMRSTVINFTAQGMKPNTKLQVYFNDFRVTDQCVAAVDANAVTQANIVLDGFTSYRGNIITDSNGVVNGTFFYDASLYKFPTGEKIFRLTDSPTNGNDNETAAEARFSASGNSGRNNYIASETVYDRRNVASDDVIDVYNPGTGTVVESQEPDYGYADLVYGYAFGRVPDADSAQYWSDNGNFTNIQTQVGAITSGERSTLAGYISSTGQVDPFKVRDDIFSGTYTPSLAVASAFESIKQVVLTGEHETSTSGLSFLMATNSGMTRDEAATLVAAQLTVAILANGSIPVGANYRDLVVGVNADANADTRILTSYTDKGEVVPRTCWGQDPLAQTFIVSGNPVTLESVDLFFSAKDSTVPMTVEIRKVINGFPTQEVIPFSRTLVNPGSITTSTTGATATNIKFDSLVYLEPGEYAIVLLANSVSYRVWISQVGEIDTITGRVINEQPYVGVLFKSQNASTWTADQTQDLKFRLYQARFSTSTTATIDLKVNANAFQRVNLAMDSLEAFPNSAVLRVHQPNHGFVNGSTTKLTGFASNTVTVVPTGNIFGVNVSTLHNVEFTVSNVQQDSYTIIMPASSNVTSITRGGGNSIVSLSDCSFDAIYPALATLEFAGTGVAVSAKMTEAGYSLSGTYQNINKHDTTELSTAYVVPCDVNTVNNISGARPLTVRLTLSTDNENVSPLIDLKKNSVVLIKNQINSPTYSNQNTNLDIVTLAARNNISFERLTANTGLINFVTVVDKANVSGVVAGTTVTVTGSSTNNSTFRVLEVLNTGANIKVYGTVTTEGAGSVVTVTNGKKFVAEEAPTGGSALAKYITKQINFVNPSSSLNIRMDVSKPSAADVKVYYKTKLVGETIDIATKEFVEITGITITDSLSGEFYEVEKQLDNLSQFESVVLKIALLSTNTATVPKVKNLRAIALE